MIACVSHLVASKPCVRVPLAELRDWLKGVMLHLLATLDFFTFIRFYKVIDKMLLLGSAHSEPTAGASGLLQFCEVSYGFPTLNPEDSKVGSSLPALVFFHFTKVL